MKQHAKTQVRNIAVLHPGQNCLDTRECLYPSRAQKSNVRENVTDHLRFRAVRPEINVLVNGAPPSDVPWPFRHVQEMPTVAAMP
jgi:hypothetical protein